MDSTSDAVAGPRAGGLTRLRVTLVPRDGVVTGLAAGIGHRLGVPVSVVRVALVVLTAAGGAGLIAYLALWVVSVDAPAPGPPPSGLVARRKAVAVVPVLFGVLLLLRDVGLWFGDALVWPLALAGVGALIIGARGAESSVPLPTVGEGAGRPVPGPLIRLAVGTAEDPRRRTILRVVAGAVLVGVGMATFLAATESFASIGQVLPAVAVTTLGLALIAGPLLYRLGRQLADERGDRIRSEERADMAAHLHDSVLQTLAMIQRSGSAREMAALARRQERELRSWLFRERADDLELTLRSAVEAMAGRVEERWQLAVEQIVVGDAPATEAVVALVEAAGEAVANAAEHAGVDRVAVYVEAEDHQVTAFVRDDGRGFDPDAVPSDRRGISHSICDRLERHGGSAEVTTAPGDGTEWQLQIPRPPG